MADPSNVPQYTKEMPTVPYRVLYAGLPFYSDPECKSQVPGANLVVLQALDPDDPGQELDIVPALMPYTAGQIVTWELNNKRLWEKCWFRNPESGEVQQAWSFHVEFIGLVVDPEVVAANSENLEKLKAALKVVQPSKPRVQ